MNEVTKEWVDKAENDFDAADLTCTAGKRRSSTLSAFIPNNAPKSI